MPQLFQVLKCYKCSVFQVHQTKKSNKWGCKLCGEIQSIKRHYGLGTGKECRLHVQKLNGIRGEIDEKSESNELNKTSDDEFENSKPNIQLKALEKIKTTNESKWSNFIENTELSPTSEENESMYLGNIEVVLEVPVRKRKKFKPPTSGTESLPSMLNYEPNEPVYNYEPNTPLYRQKKRSIPDSPISNGNTLFKRSSFKCHTTVSNPELAVKDLSPQDNDNLRNLGTEKETEESNIKNEHKKLKTYIPPKLNKNSKWAEFADEPEENEPNYKDNSIENIFSSQDDFAENQQKTNTEKKYRERQIEFVQSKASSSENVTRKLFTFCDDSEIDDVLEF